LNEGGTRGNAWGFTFNTITKLPDAKTSDLNSNLAQYLISLVGRYPKEDLINFHEDLPSAESAGRIALSQLQGELNTLGKDFAAVAKAIDNIKTITKADKFQKKMKKFIKEAEDDINSMNKKMAETLESFTKATTWFGEESAKTDPEQFFGIVNQFITIMKNSVKELEKYHDDEDKKQKREAAKAKRAKEVESKRRAKLGDNPEAHDEAIDELFSVIEDGQAFRNRRKVAKKGPGAAKPGNIFVAKQEEMLREKPLPLPKRPAKPSYEDDD